RVARCIYEGLVRNDVFSPDFTIIPAGAERWEVSDDGTAYTFHPRRDATWSNGQPVRARDYVFSWRRAVLPDTACDYTSQFFCIRGAREFFEWRTAELEKFDPATTSGAELWSESTRKFGEMVGVAAVDDLTLRVE